MNKFLAEVTLTKEQMIDLRRRRSLRLFLASYAVCLAGCTIGLVVSASIWHIDILGWALVLLFLPPIIAWAISAVYYTYTMWHLVPGESGNHND